MRLVSKVLSFTLYTDASPAVGMIHENEFSPIGMSLFKGREFSGLRPVRFFFGACTGDEYEKDEL